MSRLDVDLEALIARARQDDDEALDQLIDWFRPYLSLLTRRAIDGRLAGQVDGESVVRRTCMSVARRFGDFHGSSGNEFVAWLREVHEQILIDAARRHVEPQRLSTASESSKDTVEFAGTDELNSPGQTLMKDLGAVRLAQSISRLPVPQAEAVRLRHLEARPINTIVDQMKLSRATVIELLYLGISGLGGMLTNESARQSLTSSTLSSGIDKYHELLVILDSFHRQLDEGKTLDRGEFATANTKFSDLIDAYLRDLQIIEDFAGERVPMAAEESGSMFETQEARIDETVAEQSPYRSAEARLTADAPPTQFGRYHILKELGRGAMGAVYLAEDSQLDRKVALKIPQFDGAVSSHLLERFYREARAAGNLRHPGICPVYDVGEISGQHFITMAFIEGRPLRDFTKSSKRQNGRKVARAILKIALAMAHAHSHNVIHRDLKPANIMIDKRKEPVVMDFGLARRGEDKDARLTHTGTVIGTPAYMSPEQVDGDNENVGPAADIYSLGVIFYELLTGVTPFRGSLMSILKQISMDEPRLPVELYSDIDLKLQDLCLRMMAKAVKDRPSSMEQVADELTKWLKPPKTPAGESGLLVELRRKEVNLLLERVRSSPPRVMHHPNPRRVEVNDLPKLDMSPFDMIERQLIADLRLWKRVPEQDQEKLISPMLLTSRERFRKSKAGNLIFREARTTDHDLFTECVSHPTKSRVLASDSPVKVGNKVMKTRHLEINVSDVYVGDEFGVEMRRTFWNGWQEPKQLWVGTMIHQPILSATFLVVLPESQPFTSFRLRAAEIDGDKEFEYEGEQLSFVADDKTWLYWEIVAPKPGFVYQVHWEWNWNVSCW